MKNKKRVVVMDPIRESYLEESLPYNGSADMMADAMGSESDSDFSGFEVELPSKDINRLQGGKLKNGEGRHVVKHGANLNRNKHKSERDQKKKRECEGNKNKQKMHKNTVISRPFTQASRSHPLPQVSRSHKLKFEDGKKRSSTSSKDNQIDEDSSFQQFKLPQFRANNPQPRRPMEQKNNQCQELITEYKKSDFKHSSYNNRHRSTAKQQQHRLKSSMESNCGNQGEIVQKKGGVCFELDVRQFVYPAKSRPKKKKEKGGGSTANLNSNEQILMRRQRAFNYGQFIRRRTFGHF